MKLYGVIHGGHAEFLDLLSMQVRYEEVRVHPSSGLIKELSDLPEHTKVGVAWYSEACQDGQITVDAVEVNGKVIPFASSNIFYWGRILDTCKAKNLDVVFLDDLELFKEYAWLQFLGAEKSKRKNSLMRKPEKDESTNQELQSLTRQIYVLSVESDYANVIKRQEKILERLSKEAIDLGAFVVGEGDADYFFSQRDELAEKGIKFDSYAREEIPESSSFRSEDRPDLVDDPLFDVPMALARREHFQRRYNAAKLGRVLPYRKPQFIGTWNVDVPEFGLFEMYVLQREGINFSGSIEDIYGSAKFDGIMTDTDVRFFKTYGDAALGLGGATGKMRYRAKLSDGLWKGTFNKSEEESPSFEFWMKEFN